MRVDIICSDAAHPVVPFLQRWVHAHCDIHDVCLHFQIDDLLGGDVLFLVSCSEVVTQRTRSLYRETMVLHASDLPKGRGWSPYVWELLAGAEKITVSLLRADDPVDTGAIWAKKTFVVPKSHLFKEISQQLFETELELMSLGLALVSSEASPVPQAKDGATYWPKRSPNDSRIDPTKSLAECFDQIRIADPERYPAFFELYGEEYFIELRKKTRSGHNED